jgi:hypothetical protein
VSQLQSLLQETALKTGTHIDDLTTTDNRDKRRRTVEEELEKSRRAFDSLMNNIESEYKEAKIYFARLETAHSESQEGKMQEGPPFLEAKNRFLEDKERRLMAKKNALEIQYRMAQQFGEQFRKMQDDAILRFAIRQ